MSSRRACLACRWASPPDIPSILVRSAVRLPRFRARKVVSTAIPSPLNGRSDGCARRSFQKCAPGPSLRCERCTAIGIEDCVFDPIKKRGVGKTLRMGEACNFCRLARVDVNLAKERADDQFPLLQHRLESERRRVCDPRLFR